MTDPPPRVRELAERRRTARAVKDFATADALREEMSDLGWLVSDTAEGYSLAPAPPYRVLPRAADLPDRSEAADERRATVALLVESWPDDVRTCVRALMANLPGDVIVSALDLGNADGAGDALHDLVQEYPGRIEEWHVSGTVGWGPARNALLRADVAAVHVIMDTSTIFEGDALTPLLDRLASDGHAVAAGWRGAALDDDWRGFHDSGPGEVEALLGYLLAVRRTAASRIGGFPEKARYYRNADLEFSLSLRDAGLGTLVVPHSDLPLRQGRHRGYHDVDPAYRDRESKRNYDRLLRRFRGREDLRLR